MRGREGVHAMAALAMAPDHIKKNQNGLHLRAQGVDGRKKDFTRML